VEGPETFHAVLNNPEGASIEGPADLELMIVDDDYGVGLEDAQYSVDELGQSLTLNVLRYGVESGPVTVQYRTRDLSATAGQDYVAQTGTLEFRWWSDTNRTVTIRILDDSLVEGDETFQVELLNPTGGAVLGTNAIATVTISDNDTAAGPGRGVDGTVLTLAE